MRKLSLLLFSIISPFLLFNSLQAIESKGAIIIASLEGQVTVTNNESGNPLPGDRVKVGGMIFDGHTVETSKGSKIVLLFSSGTITTLKEDSVLNIKKFAQQKFDPKSSGKLSDRADEPSPSETVIGLSLGDMVVDVKKLKKESSFNIDSPVGTAGIRGTIPRMQVVKLPDGTINQTTQMLKGQISFMPRGGGRPMMLGPGQSLASGISAAGMSLPIQIGRVPAAVMKAIQAEVDQASAATGKALEGPPPADAPEANPEEDAPSEEELNESDDERQASSKGVGDDENGTEALALEKANIIDLENPEDKEKVDTYVEVAGTAADILEEKKVARRAGRRSSDSDKDESTFVSDLVSNFGNVVDVTEESEALGLKDSSKISSFAENSEQSGDLLAVLGDADEIGAKNAENMDAVFSNPDKASNLKKVIDVAKDTFASDRRSSHDGEEVTQDGKDTMTAMFRTAEKANEVAAVVQSAEETKAAEAAQEAAAQKATEEAEAALELAKASGDATAIAAAEDAKAEAEASALKVAEEKKGNNKVLGVFKVVESVDKAEQDKKAAEEAAAQAAAEAAAKKAAEEAAARKAAEEAAEAAEAARLLEEQLASASAEQQAQIQAELDAARLAAEEKRLAEEQATKKKAATDDYSEKLAAIKAASDSSSVDDLLAEFNSAHDDEIITALIADGLDLSSKADSRRTAIKAEASAAQKETVFGNLDDVSELAVASIEVEQQAAAEAALASGKKAAADDYQQKLSEIASADSSAEVDRLVSEFLDPDINPEEYRDGLDLSSVAEARKNILEATNEEARLAAEQAALAAKEEAEARAQAKALAAEKAKADAEAKATDTGFDNMIENADQAKNLRKIVEKNAAIEEAAAAKEDAAKDYQEKLEKIANADTVERVNQLVSAFLKNNSEEHREGLDLTSIAQSKISFLSAEDDLAREAARQAAEEAKRVAEEAAVAAAAEAEAASANKADVGSLLKNADKANDLAVVLDAAETLDTSGDSSTLTALLKNPEGATEMKKIVAESALTEGKKKAAADYQTKLTEIASAETPEAVNAIVSEFRENNLEEHRAGLDLSTLAESRITLLTAEGEAAEEAIKAAEEAAAAAAAAAEAATKAAESGKDQDALKVMFTVVKSSDAKKVAAKKAAEEAEAAGAFIPFEIEELILAAEDKAVLSSWKSTGSVNGEEFSGESLNLLQTLIANRIEEINSKNVLEKIDTVVDVAKSVQDNGGGSDLDSILDNAEKADDLKVLVDQAVSSGGDDGAASLLTNVLDNAEKASELSEVVTSAADEGVDVTQFLENANEAESLLKAKKAADEVAAKAEEDARKAIEEAGDGLSEEEIAAQVEAAKKAAKKEVMETVAANAANAESVATVLEAAEGADAETKAALLRNADQAVAMAKTIKEEEAIKAAAAAKAAEEAAAAEAAAKALEEELANASAEEQARIQAEIEAVRQAAEQRRLAEEKFTEDLRAATSLSQVDDALSAYKLVLDEGEEVPEAILNFVTSRKKNLSLINVAKQMDAKKQEAKAVAEKAEQASVSIEFREAARSKESISELKQLLLDNLPEAITDADLKTKIFRAKTENKVRELLAGFESGTIDSAVDHWMIVFPVKEEINAALAFASIDTLAEVASKTAAVAEEIVVDEGLSEDAQAAIANAREALDFAESVEEVDEILFELAGLDIEIPEGLSTFAESKKNSINALNTVLDNAEQAAQVAVLFENEDPDSGGDLLASLSSGGDDFDFEEVIATGALGNLKSARFEALGLQFDEFYAVDTVSQLSVASETATTIDSVDEQYFANPQPVKDLDGGDIYKLSADQINSLTGLTDGVEGFYSFSEVLDPDSGESIGVVLSVASKKLGVKDPLGENDYSGFAVEPERAGDVLFILDSPAIKVLETDTEDIIAKKDNLRSAFIENSDQLDNLLELNKVIGDDQAKVETAFANISSLGDLVVVSDKLRFDEAKLNQIYDLLDNGEIDDDTKSANLSFFRSLTEKLLTAPRKLDAVFANPDKLEVLDDLTSRLDRNIQGTVEEKGQVNFLFANLDYADDFLLIVNRFEGTKRDSVLSDIRALTSSNPNRKDIIFANPGQVGSLRKLYEEFKFEPSRVEVIFEFASKADAFFDVLNDLRSSEGGFGILFTDPISTMENQGLAKLKGEYPEEYWSVFDENKDRAAEIASVASKFKDNADFLSIVFSNLDKLDDINSFANEFGNYVISEDGQSESFKFGYFEIIIDAQTNSESQQFVEDNTFINIFFENINNLTALNDFKMIGELVGIPGGDAMLTFSHDPQWLEFVVGQSVLEYDESGRPLLNDDQRRAAIFVGNLYASEVPLIEIPLPLANELFTLNLTRDELKIVLVDLLEGPLLSSPDTQPPEVDDPGVNADLQTLSFLLDHSFDGSIDAELIVSAEIAMASSFFVESMETFEALSYLGHSMDEYSPVTDSDIYDPSSDGSVTFPSNEEEFSQTDETYESSTDYNDHSGPDDGPQGVLGGKSLSFGAGNYDLSLISHDRLLFAATESLSLSGEIIFTPSQIKDVSTELLLLSAGGLSISPDTKVEYHGESLGFGSFNQMNIVKVDLYAKDEISLRSLDRLVIKNSSLITSNRGIDAIELLAHQDITIDNLRLENIKRIAMEAMTVNLSNLDFPAGSQVKLNSAYGGIDGKYPNFNSIHYGRVNFIQNIRYASNPIMDRPSFDQYGSSVSIGTIGN